MVHTPEEVLIECPLGYLTAVLIKAFTCATSESSCFHSFANQIEQFFVKEPDIVEVLAHSDQLNVPDRSDGTLMELVQRTTS